MSTYTIASSIDKFTEGFIKALNEKNKIEREKLEFEKEKFKQLTNQSCIHDWSLCHEFFNGTDVIQKYFCKKCGETEFRYKGVKVCIM